MRLWIRFVDYSLDQKARILTEAFAYLSTWNTEAFIKAVALMRTTQDFESIIDRIKLGYIYFRLQAKGYELYQRALGRQRDAINFPSSIGICQQVGCSAMLTEKQGFRMI